MKIYLVSRHIHPSKEQVQKLHSLGEFSWFDIAKLSEKHVIEKIKDAEILIVGITAISRISDELLSKLKNIQFISILSVGTQWVDLKAAETRKIPISNVKGANAEAVAEHIWGMILDLSKRITEFAYDVKEKGVFDNTRYKGMNVYGKTLGVIGLGDIGQKVVRIAKGFDIKVLGINKSGREVKDVQLVDFKTLLKESDIIAICAPLTTKTNNLFTDKEFALMKEHAILINCTRHEIVNKSAVITAIKEKKLFGYGIETVVGQNIPSSDDYFKYPNILVMPHNAFNTVESVTNTFDVAIQNVESFLKGKLINRVA